MTSTVRLLVGPSVRIISLRLVRFTSLPHRGICFNNSCRSVGNVSPIPLKEIMTEQQTDHMPRSEIRGWGLCWRTEGIVKVKAGDRVVSRLKISISVTYCDPHALETEEIKTNTVPDTIVPHNGSTTWVTLDERHSYSTDTFVRQICFVGPWYRVFIK